MNRRKFINYSSVGMGMALAPRMATSALHAATGSVTGIRAVAPTVVQVGQLFDVGLSILTKPYYVPTQPNWHNKEAAVKGPFNLSPRGINFMQNVPAEWTGSVTVMGGEGYRGPAVIGFPNEGASDADDKRPIRRISGISFDSPGLKYIRFSIPGTGIEETSNVIEVVSEKPKERLFWGDLHIHSIFTDGLRTPEELYAFARDEAFLDVAAVSEHVEGLSDLQWEYFTAVTNRFNEAGKFVTIVGGEWTNMEKGHRNFYYRGSSGPMFPSDVEGLKTLEQFFAAAKENQALVIPHHTASGVMGTDWDVHDPDIERLVEIHSVWGNSERHEDQGNKLSIKVHGGEKKGRHVQDALAKGFRLGFVGGGDIHDGRPGDEFHHLQDKPSGYKDTRKQAIMAVWASELTREAIFDALWNRRVYATTNHRTLLRFSVNGAPMGSMIIAEGTLSIRIEVATHLPIDCVELVANGKDIQVHVPEGDRRIAKWSTTAGLAGDDSWFYARVTLCNGTDYAWSSPVWVSRNAKN